MEKLTICGAIIKVLKLAGEPLTPNQIYDLIIANKLYNFKSATPLNVVKAEIRKHTNGVSLKGMSSMTYFILTDSGKIWIK